MAEFQRERRRQDLTPLLHAESVAVVGISRPGRFGGMLYENLEKFGYPGTMGGPPWRRTPAQYRVLLYRSRSVSSASHHAAA